MRSCHVPPTKDQIEMAFLSLCENDDSVFIMTSRKGKLYDSEQILALGIPNNVIIDV